MQTYDVLIVGGVPAGSTLAYSLKNSGLKIGILEDGFYFTKGMTMIASFLMAPQVNSVSCITI